jgi:hypothetical protein
LDFILHLYESYKILFEWRRINCHGDVKSEFV